MAEDICGYGGDPPARKERPWSGLRQAERDEGSVDRQTRGIDDSDARRSGGPGADIVNRPVAFRHFQGEAAGDSLRRRQGRHRPPQSTNESHISTVPFPEGNSHVTFRREWKKEIPGGD